MCGCLWWCSRASHTRARRPVGGHTKPALRVDDPPDAAPACVLPCECPRGAHKIHDRTGQDAGRGDGRARVLPLADSPCGDAHLA